MAPDIVDALVGHQRRTVGDAYGELPVEALLRKLCKVPESPLQPLGISFECLSQYFRAMDTLTPEERSRRMARIRSKGTKLERIVRSLLHADGYRFRVHRRDLPGSPDIVFPSRRKAIFVHGCFWHGLEGCRVANMPKSRTEYWRQKFARNHDAVPGLGHGRRIQRAAHPALVMTR